MTVGLYVPDKKGQGFEFKESKTVEERPILSYEADTGRVLLNINLLLMQNGRRLQDVSIISNNGVIQGIMCTSEPMGPEEIKALKEQGIIKG